MIRLAREWSDTEIVYKAPRALVKEFSRKRLAKVIDYIIGNIKGITIRKRKVYGAYEYFVKKSINGVKFIEEINIIEPYGVFVYLYFRSLDEARKVCIEVLNKL